MIVGHIGGGSVGVDTGDIPASLRFRSAASAYLSKTPAGPGSQTKWALSFWVKRGLPSTSGSGGVTSLFAWRHSVAGQNGGLSYNGAADKFQFSEGATNYRITNSVSRDPTGHEHIYLVWDSNNATQSLRCQIWRNGVLQTYSTELAITIGATLNANTAVIHTLGADYPTTGVRDFFDGYISRVAFFDNAAPAVTELGYLNTEINEWVTKTAAQVKAVVDAGGTNSFMLDFDDPNFATYNVGKDFSSKGNHWTPNNFSLTAGTSYDWMLDVPGNSFATLNPLAVNTAVTPANGNLSYTASNDRIGKATQSVTSGKWYWEFIPGGGGSTTGFGFVNPATNIYAAVNIGIAPAGISYTGAGSIRLNNAVATTGASFAASDVLGVAIDLDGLTVQFYKNGSAQGSAVTIASGLEWCPAVDQNVGTNYLCFGQAPLHASATYHSAAGGYFRYAPPTGFKALCQRNMPDPAILNPEKHFDVVTRTGTAATYSVAGLGFQPDLVWVKSRGRAVDHALYDSVRGVQKQLESNQTGAETTESTGLTAFNSGGYTGGALDQINGTTATNSFVDWLWKAGGAPVTNNAGSISSQVSANVEAGFSIVTYTGTGANATVGHGLGKAPGLILNKMRGVVNAWQVYHKNANASPASGKLFLNQTDAFTSEAALWNSTLPTSSVFSLGTSANANGNGSTYVAYCFAEIPGYSKIFSYTGNGSADGPFVDCGFKPKYVLLKNINTDSSWYVLDAVRSDINVVNDLLYPNQSAAETTAYNILDFVSNGFKLRDGASAWNSPSGNTIVGIAFADVPAKYSLAR